MYPQDRLRIQNLLPMGTAFRWVVPPRTISLQKFFPPWIFHTQENAPWKPCLPRKKGELISWATRRAHFCSVSDSSIPAALENLTYCYRGGAVRGCGCISVHSSASELDDKLNSEWLKLHFHSRESHVLHTELQLLNSRVFPYLVIIGTHVTEGH